MIYAKRTRKIKEKVGICISSVMELISLLIKLIQQMWQNIVFFLYKIASKNLYIVRVDLLINEETFTAIIQEKKEK